MKNGPGQTKKLDVPPSLECFPKAIQNRLRQALALLADASWYAPWFAERDRRGPCALRISDLLRAGLNSLDCKWLLAAGYVTTLARNSRRQERKAARGLNPIVDVETYVILSPFGEAAASQTVGLGCGDNDTGGNGRLTSEPSPRLIHYDDQSRQLFLGEVAVLELPGRARHMERVMMAFEQDGWQRHHVASPFKSLTTSQRAGMVREVVHRLNKRQNPCRIEFHSRDKGARIAYEIAVLW